MSIEYDEDEELNKDSDENLFDLEDSINDDVGSDEDEELNKDSDEDENDNEDDIMFKFNTNNHKIEGKHALNRDTIFKGKIDDDDNEDGDYSNIINVAEGFPIEIGSRFEFESKRNEEYIGRLNLSKDVYQLLQEKTELDFSSNRRKPNRQAFNDYFSMLIKNIGTEYTKSEIFVELSYYFTDNIFNMFKLLDKKYATQIIMELKRNGYLTNLNNINFI